MNFKSILSPAPLPPIAASIYRAVRRSSVHSLALSTLLPILLASACGSDASGSTAHNLPAPTTPAPTARLAPSTTRQPSAPLARRSCDSLQCPQHLSCEVCDGEALCIQPRTSCPSSAPALAPASLVGSWVEDHEHAVQGETRWIPANRPVPPSEFRGRMTLEPGGVLRILVLHPADAHYEVRGTYRLVGRTLIEEYTTTHNGAHVRRRLEVVETTPGLLRLRAIPSARRRPPAIPRSALVGTWTRTIRTDVERFEPCTPGAAPAGPPRCPLALLRDGSAIVIASGDDVGTVVLRGRWTLDDRNGLRIEVPSEPRWSALFDLLAVEGSSIRLRTNFSPYGW